MLDQALILLFIISFLTLALGAFVFLKDRKSKANSSFFLLSLSALVWINASYFEDEVSDASLVNFLLNLDFASGAFFAFFVLLFCLYVSNIRAVQNFYFVGAMLLIPNFLTILVFFTDFILSGFETVGGGTANPLFGQGKWVYNIIVAVAPIGGIGFLAWRYKNARMEDKSKFIYLFIGFFFTMIAILLTNIFLTKFIEDSPNYILYSRLGTFSVVFMIIFSGYSIIKHQLFNIKVLASEILSLAILIFSLFQVLGAKNLYELVSNLFIFVGLIIFILMLVRSVKSEVQRKEELQLMSDKLSLANAELIKLDNAKAEFISIASHQLRTPLTAIKGFISLLLEGSYGKLAPKQEEALNKAYLSNNRLIALVEDLLNVSRIESGKMDFKFDQWSLEKLCREVVDMFVLRAKDNKLGLEFVSPEKSLPEITIDGLKVREVISNLVDNAIKYTPKGGVNIRLEQDETNVRVIVADTGIGIPAGELPYLFAKFSRGKDINRLNTGGTGLGLYVGKNIIESNGGKIWAESEGEGKGSAFIIQLPLKQSPEILERWG